MDVTNIYTLATSGHLTLQSLPLLLTPSLIVSLLSHDPRRPSDLEVYLCRTLGLTLLTLAATLLPLTALLPASTLHTSESTDPKNNPYAYPTLITTTIYHALTSFYLYTQLTYSWSFAYTAGLTFSAGLFCFGLWVLMFGNEKGKISKTTGADKRTGNFPFVNVESSREKKKEAKEKEREKGSGEEKDKERRRRTLGRTRSSRD